MKRNFTKRAFSLLLALMMLLPLASTAIAMENSATEKVSSSQLLGGGASDFGLWALEKLGSGFLSSLGGKGADAAFAAIFGDDTSVIMEKLEEISQKLDKINDRLDDLTRDIATGKLYTVLNEYQSFISPYKALYKLLANKIEEYKDNPDDTEAFLMDIYKGDKSAYRIGGDGILSLALNLSEKLLQVHNGEYNIFGAFDKLDRYVHRWEHQGYKDRQDFRDVVVGFYVQFSALSQLSCQKAMDLAGEGTYAYREAKVEKQTLIDNAKIIDKMYKRCAVIQHPDLRIVRGKEGQDLYAFYRDVKAAYVEKLSDWDCENGYTFHAISPMMASPVKYISDESDQWMNPKRREIVTNQASASELREIRQLYCKDTDYKKTLYDILFDPNEGGFNNIGNLKRGTSFTGNRYKYFKYSDSKNSYTRWEAAELLTDSEGRFDQPRTHRLSRIKNQSTMDHWSDEKYFSIVRYDGYINQGNLKDPGPGPEPDGLISGMDASYALPANRAINLSVEVSDGATYQWLVDKNDGKGLENIEGEVAATYIIPSLNPNMNGWRYQCAIIEGEVSDWGEGYTLTETVTLNLTGEGIPALVTVHEVGTSAELKTALDKMSDGTWDGHTIKLTDSIVYPGPITLLDHSLTIDLNGFALTVQPDSDSEANINPMSNMAEIAAVYACFGSLDITGDGTLDVVAGDGITYGVYAGKGGNVTVSDVTSTGGGTAVYATDGGSVEVTGSVSADGDNIYAIECFDGSNVFVSGNVSVTGKSACGMYVESFGENRSDARAGKNLTVSGEGGRAGMACGNAWLFVFNNVTGTGNQSTGVSAGGQGSWVMVVGNITSPADAVSAWNGAGVSIGNPEFELEEGGNITVTDENATAISVAGAEVAISRNVTSSGSGGTGIHVSAWDLEDPAVGAWVMVDGKISACTPLRIESLPVEESEGTEDTDWPDYRKFTDGTSSVFAKPDSFIAHEYNGEYTVEVSPTCTLPGSESIHCSKCGEVKSGSNRVNPATGHTESDWMIDKAATLTEEGSRHKECTVCKEILKTGTIPKLPSKDMIVDSATGIQVEYEDESKFDSTVTLSVTLKSKDEIDKLKDSIDKAVKGFTLAGLYDIKLLKDGIEIQPDGKIKVSIPLTDEMKALTDLKVVYIDDESNVTIIQSQISGDKIIFTTDHLSQYGVIGKVKTESDPGTSPQTGDSFPIIPLVALAISSATGMILLTVQKKRKMVAH